MGKFAILPAMGNNLKSLREERGWTHERAAEEMGVSRSQFIKLERGERRLTLDYINQAARAFDVRASDVIENPDDPQPGPELEPGIRRVMVAGFMQAGNWDETWEWDDGDKYPVLIPDLAEYKTVRLYAAETRGTSMNKRYPERTIIVFTDVQETMEEPIPGKRYVVQRRRVSGEAEHTVKLMHQDNDGNLWLMPESDDPRFQTPISVEEGTGDGDTIIILGRVVFSVTRE